MTYANTGADESATAETGGALVVKPDGATITARAEKPGWINSTNTADYALAGALQVPDFFVLPDVLGKPRTLSLRIPYPAGVIVRVKIARDNNPDWTVIEDEICTLPGLALDLGVGAVWVRGVATDPNGVYRDSAPGVYRLEELLRR